MDCGNKWKDQYRFTKMVFSDDQAKKLAPELRVEMRKDDQQWTVIGYYADNSQPYSDVHYGATAHEAARQAFLNCDTDLCIVDVLEGVQTSALDNDQIIQRVEDLDIEPARLMELLAEEDEDRTGRPPPDVVKEEDSE